MCRGQYALQQRIDQPRQNAGNSPSQRDRLVLEVNAPVFFFDPPITIEPPQETTILSDRELSFIWLA